MNTQENAIQTTLESIITPLPRNLIDWCLETIAPDVVVVGSRIAEDGWELVLEGTPVQVSELVYAIGLADSSEAALGEGVK